MTRTRVPRVLSLLASLALCVPVGAQAPSIGAWTPGTSGPAAAVTQTPAGATSGSVIGTVWDSDNMPVGDARIRLRSVDTGQVAANAVASLQGEFTFDGVPPGSYVTELVNDRGNVLALGQTFALEPGQTVITFVRLPARGRSFMGGVWGSAAAAAVAAAAGLGITAVQPCSCPPASGEF